MTMEHTALLCPYCAATTTLEDWEVISELELIGFLAEHRGECRGQVWLSPGAPSPSGARRIEVVPVRTPEPDTPPATITGYAHLCATRGCPSEGLATPLAEGEDLTGTARCPTCEVPMAVYACYEGSGVPWRSYEPIPPAAEDLDE